MYERLGKILDLGLDIGTILEERTENNKGISDETLRHEFLVNEVVYLNQEKIKKDDLVWFSLVKPCGGKEMIDTIRKPLFPSH